MSVSAPMLQAQAPTQVSEVPRINIYIGNICSVSGMYQELCTSLQEGITMIIKSQKKTLLDLAVALVHRELLLQTSTPIFPIKRSRLGRWSRRRSWQR